MARYERLVFVCTNTGREGDTKARCGKQGGEQLLERLKACAADAGKRGRVRVTRSGCLGLCARGCAALALSEQEGEAWYVHLTPDDAERLFAEAIEHERDPALPALRRLPKGEGDGA